MLLFFDNEFSPVLNERLYERLLGNNYICLSKDVPCQWNIVQSVNEGGVFWSVHFSSNTNILVAARGSPRKIELWTNHLFQWRPLLSGWTLVVNATASLRMETSHKNSEKKSACWGLLAAVLTGVGIAFLASVINTAEYRLLLHECFMS